MHFYLKRATWAERLRTLCLCAFLASMCLVNFAKAQSKSSDGDAWNTGSVFAAAMQCEMKGYITQGQTVPLFARILQHVPAIYAQALNLGYHEGLKRTAIYSKNFGRWVAYSLTTDVCSKVQYTITQYRLGTETILRSAVSSKYLTGPARKSFIAGTVNGCMRDYGAGSTSIIPKPLFEKYCQCFAAGLADHVPASDLRSKDHTVTDPVVKADGDRCYAKIKEEALRNYLEQH